MLKLQFKQIRNITSDSFRGSSPCVRLVPKLGIVEKVPKNTGVAKLLKDNSYSLSNDNVLTFTLDNTKKIKFLVNLIFVGDGNQNITYDGEGTIVIADKQPLDRICELYLDGDESNIVGDVIYSIEILPNSEVISIEPSKAQLPQIIPTPGIQPTKDIQPTKSLLATLPNNNANVPSSKINSKKVKVLPDPEWVANIQNSKPVTDHALSELSLVSKAIENITVRIHGIIITNDANDISTTVSATATLRLGFSPVTNKTVTMRSSNSSYLLQQEYINFGGRTCTLQLTAGDLRSKLLKDGATLQLAIELSFRGFIAEGSIYVPWIAAANAQKTNSLFILPLHCNALEAVHSNYKIELLMEFNAETNNSTNSSPDILTMPILQTPSIADIVIELEGFIGLEYTSGMRIEASLTSSSKKVTETFEPKIFKTGFIAKVDFILTSTHPESDILLLKVILGQETSSSSVVGLLSIPVSCILSSITKGMKAYPAFLLVPDKRKSNGNGMGGALVKSDWSFVCNIEFEKKENELMKISPSLLLLSDYTDPALITSGTTNATAAATSQNHLNLPTTEDNNQFQNEEECTDDIPARQDHLPLSQKSSIQQIDRKVSETNSKKKKPELIKSTHGNLIACVQGLIFDSKDRNNSLYFDKSDKYSVEILVMPENVKQIIKQVNASKSISENFIGIEFAKIVSLPVAWSYQQRFVGHLKILVYKESTKGSSSSSSRKLCCSALIDVTSLVIGTGQQELVCNIPMVSGASILMFRDAPKSDNVVNGDVVDSSDDHMEGMLPVTTLAEPPIAWLCCAFKFSTTSPTVSTDIEEQSVKAWSSILLQAPQLRLLNYLPDLTISPTLHVSIGSFVISEVKQYSGLLSSGSGVLRIRSYSGEVNCHVHTSGESVNLECSDIMVPFTSPLTYSIFLEMSLWDEGLSTCLCSAAILLSGFSLSVGHPIDILVPLRDSNGLRLAILQAGFQLPATSSSQLPTTIRSSTSSRSSLQVRFLTGLISDTSTHWKMEPYFECSLQYPNHDNPSQLIVLTQSVTSFLTPNHSDTSWGISCNLELPNDIIDTVTNDHTQPIYLMIVCRDAARFGCPEVGYSRMALPMVSFSGLSEVKQWLDLTPATASGSNQKGRNRNRIYISLQRNVELDEVEYLQQGPPQSIAGASIGKTLIWALNNADPYSKEFLKISDVTSIRASVRLQQSTAIQLAESATLDEDDREEIDSALICQPYNSSSSFFGSLFIPRGGSDVIISAMTKSSDVPLVGMLPCLASASSSGTYDSNTNGMSEINVFLSPPSSSSSPTRFELKRPCRLKLRPVFVPFVRGRLIIAHSSVILSQNASRNFFTPSPALRFSMGNRGNVFTSDFVLDYGTNINGEQDVLLPLQIDNISVAGSQAIPNGNSKLNPQKSTTSKKSDKIDTSSMFGLPVPPTGLPKQSKRPKANVIQSGNKKSIKSTSTPMVAATRKTSIIQMPIDTFELFNQGGDQCGGVSPETIASTVQYHEESETLDLSVKLLNLSGDVESASSYTLGIGSCNTSILYFQAVRKALSIGAANHTSDSTSSDELGSSPWLQTSIQLYDPLVPTLTVASVTLSLRFMLDGVPLPVLRSIQLAKGEMPSNVTDLARSELGLKQAFQLADTDHSGSVSVKEMLANFSKNKAKKPKVVGLDENASELLLHLVTRTIHSPDLDLNNEKDLDVAVNRLFKRLDLDGDGTLSWWEWRQLLSATSYDRDLTNNSPIDPSDPLVLSLQAAHSAVMSLNRQNKSSVTVAPVTSIGDIPAIPIMNNHWTAINQESTHNLRPSNSDLDSTCGSVDIEKAMELPPAKAVAKLHEMIRSLRNSRTRLSQRLEHALEASQEIGGGEGGKNEDSIHSSTLRRKLKLLEEEAAKMRELFELERRRALEIENELNSLKGTSELVVKHQTEKNNMLWKSQAALQSEIDIEKSKMEAAKEKRIKYFHSLLIVNRCLRHFIRRFQQNKRTKSEMILKQFLADKIVHHRYIEKKTEREAQLAVMRSVFAKFQINVKLRGLVSLQSTFRGRRDRQLVKSLKENKIKELKFSVMQKSAIVIQKLFRKVLAKRIVQKRRQLLEYQIVQKAAAQAFVENAIKLRQSKLQSERDKEERIRRELASLKLQAALRKLLIKNKEEHLKKENNRRNDAAITLQAAARGKIARKNYTSQIKIDKYIRIIQSFTRNWLVRNAYNKKFLEKFQSHNLEKREAAATIIQANVRSRIDYNKYKEMKEKRLNDERNTEQAREKLRNESAASIQALYRGNKDRAVVASLKEVEKEKQRVNNELAFQKNRAAVLLQVLFRGCRDRAIVKILREVNAKRQKERKETEKRENAAITIQCQVRSRQAMKSTEELKFIKNGGCPNRPPLENAVGYFVNIRLLNPKPSKERDKFLPNLYFKGQVIAIDPIQKALIISVMQDDKDADDGIISLGYDDVTLRYFPQLFDENNVMILRKYFLPETLVFEDEIDVVRPDINNAIGYRLRILLTEETHVDDSIEESFLEGKVVDVNTRKGSLLVSCPTESENGYFLYEYSYDSPDIEWYIPFAMIDKQLEKKPSIQPHLEQAVHYSIEIPYWGDDDVPIEGQSEEIAVVAGDVIGIDVSKGSIRVQFELEGGGKEEREIKANDPQISWFVKHRIFTGDPNVHVLSS